jgi:hypothetical protein
MCNATGFANSEVEPQTYTITVPEGGVAAPTPTSPAGTYFNDFSLGLTTGTAGATICFTLDGSKPKCTAGVCEGSSQTYNAQSQIKIDGSVTDPTTGIVKVNALACLAGDADGVLPESSYTLQVATPTLQGPSPGALTFNAAGPVQTATFASQTNGATGLYTAKASIGAMVSCTNGTPATGQGGNSPAGSLPSPFTVDETKGDQTFWLVGCKPGYAQSTVYDAAYTVTLNPASFTPVSATYAFNQTVSVDDHLNLGAPGEYVCVTTDGVTAAACTATGCAAKNTKYTGAVMTGLAPIAYSANSNKVDVNGAVLSVVACSGPTTGPTYTDAGAFSTPPYVFQLDPISFTPPAGTAIPAAGSLSVVIAENVVTAGDRAYDFICSSQTAAVPNCTCTAAGLTKTVGVTVPAITVSAATTLSAVGCLNTATAAAPDVYNPSQPEPATAAYAAAGTMASPAITPGATINNPTRIQFVNNNAAGGASAYFCYTSDGTTPAYASTGPNTCYLAGSTHGSTTCTTSPTLPQASSLTTDATALSVITTATTVNAIACDAALPPVQNASATATPVDYTLVVGNPTIAPKGAVVLGSAITITTATWPTATNAVNIHYSEDGTKPDCSTAYPTLPVTCAGGTCLCGPAPGTAAACADPTLPPIGAFTATYYAMGGDGNTAAAPKVVGGTLNVIACATGYTSSAGTDNSTLTPFTAATPTFTAPAGQYDDYITVTLAETPGTYGNGFGWFCVGAGAGCGATTMTCTGVGVVESNSTPNYVLGAGNVHAGGQPSVAPSFRSTAMTGIPLPSATLGNTLTAVACEPADVPATAAQAAILSSATGTATYTFKTSAVALTTPAPSTNVVGSAPLVFNEVGTTAAPDGTTTGPVNGATNGAGTWVCATTQALPAQPSACATLNTLPGFFCQPDTGAVTQGAPGPTLTIPDVGAGGTYNTVSCKDLMTWNTGTATVSFEPYSRTIAMTGAVADFNADETIAGTGGTAYVSWDLTNLYLGLTNLTNAALANTDYVQVYVGSSNGTGVGTTDTLKVLNTAALPAPTFPAGFNALYHVWWKADNTDQGINAYVAGWQTTTTNTFEVQFNQASSFVEFAIPLTSLAVAGNDLHLLGGDWTGAANEAEWPTSNTNVKNWGGWQTEFLNDAFKPNDVNNLSVP